MDQEKTYIDANGFLRDSWRLGRMVLDSGWKPDFLLALWRGGAAVGAAVHEYLKIHGVSPRHMPVKCSSYTGIGEAGDEVVFEYADSVFADIPAGAKTLVVDDVFDSGRTAAAVLDRLAGDGRETRIACVYWKPSKSKVPFGPDYHVGETDGWIVFPHEIQGLAPEEIAEKDPVLAALM